MCMRPLPVWQSMLYRVLSTSRRAILTATPDLLQVCAENPAPFVRMTQAGAMFTGGSCQHVSQNLNDCWERLLQLSLHSLRICDACKHKTSAQLALAEAVHPCASIKSIESKHLVPWRPCACTEQTDIIFTTCNPQHHLQCAVD